MIDSQTLSDGARIDLFRRCNGPDLSHEQISRSHELADHRIKELLDKLDEELRGIIYDSAAPNAAKISARQRMEANEAATNRFAKPGAAFERVVNRTLGKPKEDPKVIINKTNILNIGTEHLFDNIAAYLAGEKQSGTDFRLGARPLLDGPDHRKSDPEESTGERGDTEGDSEGGGG